MGDNLHDTYDLDLSIPFSEVQWPSPSNRARGKLQDHDTDQDNTEEDRERSVDDEVIQPGEYFSIQKTSFHYRPLRL
jgi:hypothetical protein